MFKLFLRKMSVFCSNDETTRDDVAISRKSITEELMPLDILFKTDPNSLTLFEYAKTSYIRIVDIYDGDTITVMMIHCHCVEKHKMRIRGIDTAERRGHFPPEYKEFAENGKRYLEELLNKRESQLYLATFDGYDLYGRLLGDIYIDNKPVSELMIESGYALEYSGKTKANIDTWMEHIHNHKK